MAAADTGRESVFEGFDDIRVSEILPRESAPSAPPRLGRRSSAGDVVEAGYNRAAR